METKSMAEMISKFNEMIPLLREENFDIIVAINRGGVIPAGILNQKLNLPLHIININYRDDDHRPRYDEPRMMNDFSMDIKDKKILLVDDVCRSGKTISLARKIVGNNMKTLIVNGKGDYSLYDGECFLMPWRM